MAYAYTDEDMERAWAVIRDWMIAGGKATPVCGAAMEELATRIALAIANTKQQDTYSTKPMRAER